MVRLRRVSVSSPGHGRRKRGRSFVYPGLDGAPLGDDDEIARCNHDQWRERRNRKKHDHVLEFAARLPAARRRVFRDLDLPGLPREKVLALAFRLLDLAYFRAGGEIYEKQNGSFGLATIRREHARVSADGTVHFQYPAKSGQVRDIVVEDDQVRDVAEELGNTPAVARASYIDPRLIDLWERGQTIGHRRTSAAAERAVLQLLG